MTVLGNKTGSGTTASQITGVCISNNQSPAISSGSVTYTAVAGAYCGSATISTIHSNNFTLNVSINGSTSIHGYYDIYLVGDSSVGAATVALGTGCAWKVRGGGSGAIPAVKSVANDIDKLHIEYDGTNCYASFVPYFN